MRGRQVQTGDAGYCWVPCYLGEHYFTLLLRHTLILSTFLTLEGASDAVE